MVRSWSSVALVVAVGLFGGAAQSHAQISSPVGFGLVGGMSSPIGTFSDRAKSGWHAGAFVELKLPVVPVGFRLDGTWHQFGDKPDEGGDGTTGARVAAVTLNATYTVLPLPVIKPYLIGGVGEYSVRLTSPVVFGVQSSGATAREVSTTQTKFGLNAGAGVRLQLPGFAVFAEARVHNIFTNGKNVQMVPVSFGLRF